MERFGDTVEYWYQKSYVRRSKWRRLPVPQSVINIMNKEAGQQHVEFTEKVFTTNELQIEAEATHKLTYIPRLPVTTEEAMIVDFPADG